MKVSPMLGDSSSTVLATASSGGNGEPPPVGSGEVGHAAPSNINNNNNSGEEGRDEGDRSFGGNRWPRQETLALLKIRSEMDVAFRDASVKGPLWEEVSRKLAELGYNRNAKKCKEKFENVYKYHKRTKDGRTGKHEGKAYRFFDQLEAFDHLTHSSSISSPTQPPPQPLPQIAKPPASVVNATQMPVANAPPPTTGASHIAVPSTTIAATIGTVIPQGIAPVTATVLPTVSIPIPPPSNPTILPPATVQLQTNPTTIPSAFPSFSPDLLSNSTSSSTSSDMEIEGRRRKRKWKDFFERLMKDVVYKQEEMQRKFLEAIEKREQERMAREDSWRMQEMARINREREILAQERSMAAAKDAAVMALLQKFSEQQNPGQSVLNNNQPQSQPQPQPQPQTNPLPQLQPVQAVQPPKPTPAPPQVAVAPVPLPQPPVTITNMEIVTKSDNGDQNFLPASSSRWPKVEVQALIRLRTNLDSKYQENGPKGPLWEEISAGMKKLGYNRSAKRCKEKWENINKYFKKVKESNKKRPEDSKTCPYFHQLEALYKEKHKNDQFRPENSVPLMVMPEQQWPPAPQDHRQDSAMDDLDSEDNQNDDEKEDDDDDEAGEYEIVASKAAASMSTE